MLKSVHIRRKKDTDKSLTLTTNQLVTKVQKLSLIGLENTARLGHMYYTVHDALDMDRPKAYANVGPMLDDRLRGKILKA